MCSEKVDFWEYAIRLCDVPSVVQIFTAESNEIPSFSEISWDVLGTYCVYDRYIFRQFLWKNEKKLFRVFQIILKY